MAININIPKPIYTTAEVADSVDARYVTDAELTVIQNTSGTNTGDQDLSGLVPYTGATADVDLDDNGLDAKFIKIKGTGGNGHLNLKHQSSGSTAGGSESVIYADNIGNPKWKNDGNAVQNVMLENSAITGATKTKITYDSKGLVTAGADATTADIADSSNKRYVTDANLTVIGNTSGTNTGDQTLSGLGGVPTTRNITINGTTQDLSADRTFTVSTGLTVGTTPVTSGTDGRVFFQAGGVVQQDSAFFWDNTNKRLGVGATPAGARLDVRAQGALSTDIAFRVRNSADTATIGYIAGNGLILLGENASTAPTVIVNPGGASRLLLRGGTNQALTFSSSGFAVLNCAQGFDAVAGSAGSSIFRFRNGNGGNISLYYGGLQIGTLQTASTSTNFTLIANGVAPSVNYADSHYYYSADITAGNAAPHFRTENGAIVKVYQETTAVGASTLVGNAGTNITDTDTFDGYTIQQIVKALRNQGLLA